MLEFTTIHDEIMTRVHDLVLEFTQSHVQQQGPTSITKIYEGGELCRQPQRAEGAAPVSVWREAKYIGGLYRY